MQSVSSSPTVFQQIASKIIHQQSYGNRLLEMEAILLDENGHHFSIYLTSKSGVTDNGVKYVVTDPTTFISSCLVYSCVPMTSIIVPPNMTTFPIPLVLLLLLLLLRPMLLSMP